MSTISNEVLEKLSVRYRLLAKIHDGSESQAWEESALIVEELLALRKERERAEPAYYLNQIDYGDGEGFELRAYFRELDAMKSKDDFGGVVIPAYTAPPATDKVAETAVCPKCGNTGLADSGGVQPWGEPILIECDCTAPPAPVAAGWIACSERMPEISEEVLMRISCNDHFNIESGKYKGDGLWLGCWFSNYGKKGSPYQVTHWMPIPAAPEPCK
ncbi:DUF551 domain-containing protein [Cronobacter malonaticus]